MLPLATLLLAVSGQLARAGTARPPGRAPHEVSHNLSNAVTVVVNFNMHNPVKLEVVRMLHTAYSAAFHRVVFTGQERPAALDEGITWTHCEFQWTFFSLCLAYTMAEYPEAREGGYIFIGDDTVRRAATWTPMAGACLARAYLEHAC